MLAFATDALVIGFGVLIVTPTGTSFGAVVGLHDDFARTEGATVVFGVQRCVGSGARGEGGLVGGWDLDGLENTGRSRSGLGGHDDKIDRGEKGQRASFDRLVGGGSFTGWGKNSQSLRRESRLI